MKKLLNATELDGKAIKSLVQKLGKETIAIVGIEETTTAKHLKELGEALQSRVRVLVEARSTAPRQMGGRRIFRVPVRLCFDGFRLSSTNLRRLLRRGSGGPLWRWRLLYFYFFGWSQDGM